MNKPSFDRNEIIRTIKKIVGPGNVTELRALDGVLRGDRRTGTASGYFDSADKLADAVAQIERAKGIYFIPNAVDAALLARASNRIRMIGKGESLTSDQNILRRLWLLIDLDPQRPSGISSTEAEHALARLRAEAVREFLRGLGWPEPLLADSGNGWHLLYRIDLRADDHGVVQRCLAALAAKFDDDAVKVDQSVFNPSRIWKLYGTVACKGDSTADRPHRLSKLVDVPEVVQIVSLEQLTAMAAEAGSRSQVESSTWASDMVATGTKSFDIDAWMHKHIPDAGEPKQWSGGPKMWSLPACPFSTAHTDGAFVGVLDNGKLTAGCKHNSCAGKNWHDLREKLEPAATRRVGQWGGGDAYAQGAAGASGNTPPKSTTGDNGSAGAVPLEWGQPRSFDSGPTPPAFPLAAAFPAALMDIRLYVEAVAEQLQVPVDLSAMTLLAMTSICIAKKFEIELRIGWREIAALWVLVLLYSGERKSGTFSIMVAPILKWEQDEAERLAPLIAKCLEERKVAEARLAECRKKAAKANASEVKEFTARAVDLAQILAKMEIIKAPMIYMSEATTEGLCGMLVENQERGLVASAEADALDVMLGRYDETKSPNMGIWLKGHAGDSERVIRRSRPPEYLIRPTLSVALVVQPEAVRGLLTNRAARGRGFLGRILASAPASMLGQRKTGGAARPIPEILSGQYHTALRRLLDMPIHPETSPEIVSLTPEARAMFDAFEASVEKELAVGGSLRERSDWGGKLCGAIARIALVLYTLQLALEGGIEGSARSVHEIDAATMRAALGWAPYLIDHERIVSGVVGSDRDTTVAEKIVAWLRRDGLTKFTRREAFTQNRSVLVQVVEDIDGALGLLEEYGYIRRKPDPAPGPQGGRRPSAAYLVNPNLGGGGQ